MPKKRLFHFNIGDSHTGPIMMECGIHAATRDAALNRLKRIVPKDGSILGFGMKTHDLEYMRFFVNTKNIYTRDILYITDLD